MRYIRNGRFLLVLGLTAAIAWGQGGRGNAGRGAATAQQTPAGRGAGRGGGAGAGSGSESDFYNYHTSAPAVVPIAEGQPTETQQKVTVNGQPLAYTARVGYLPLVNATSGQTEAHIFYTFYAKATTSEAPARPL